MLSIHCIFVERFMFIQNPISQLLSIFGPGNDRNRIDLVAPDHYLKHANVPLLSEFVCGHVWWVLISFPIWEYVQKLIYWWPKYPRTRIHGFRSSIETPDPSFYQNLVYWEESPKTRPFDPYISVQCWPLQILPYSSRLFLIPCLSFSVISGNKSNNNLHMLT